MGLIYLSSSQRAWPQIAHRRGCWVLPYKGDKFSHGEVSGFPELSLLSPTLQPSNYPNPNPLLLSHFFLHILSISTFMSGKPGHCFRSTKYLRKSRVSQFSNTSQAVWPPERTFSCPSLSILTIPTSLLRHFGLGWDSVEESLETLWYLLKSKDREKNTDREIRCDVLFLYSALLSVCVS